MPIPTDFTLHAHTDGWEKKEYNFDALTTKSDLKATPKSLEYLIANGAVKIKLPTMEVYRTEKPNGELQYHAYNKVVGDYICIYDTWITNENMAAILNDAIQNEKL